MTVAATTSGAAAPATAGPLARADAAAALPGKELALAVGNGAAATPRGKGPRLARQRCAIEGTKAVMVVSHRRAPEISPVADWTRYGASSTIGGS
jgi:hypothetical protein